MEVPPNYSNYPRGEQGNHAIPTRGPGVYFDYINQAFTMMKAEPTVFVLGSLAIFVLTMLVQAPFQVINQVMMPQASKDPEAAMGMLAILLPISAIEGILLGGLQWALYTGISLATIEYADTGSTKFETLFSGFKNFGQLLLASILYSIALMVGFVCCIVPMFYLIGALAFTQLIVIKEHIPAIPAMKRSYALLKPFAWSMAGLIIVTGLLNIVGFLACCVGLLVTMPIMYMVVGLAYRDFRNVDTTNIA